MKLLDLLLETNLNLSEEEENILNDILKEINFKKFTNKDSFEIDLSFKKDGRHLLYSLLSNNSELINGLLNGEIYIDILAQKYNNQKFQVKGFLGRIYVDVSNYIKNLFKEKNFPENKINDIVDNIKFTSFFVYTNYNMTFSSPFLDCLILYDPKKLSPTLISELNNCVTNTPMFNLSEEQYEDLGIQAEKIKELFSLYDNFELNGNNYEISGQVTVGIRVTRNDNPVAINVYASSLSISKNNERADSKDKEEIRNMFTKILEDYHIPYEVTINGLS